ncbi:MAG: putative toxin-antitoxin system toxin component, PIN family [Bifidobacteriaceae bacterium]|jgi:putative PIN family toxin of toxin-antitoxin system|nr:putative toxin-antitoxin system toxin component, PIN family [Bifidobacteriaceae bacterium]
MARRVVLDTNALVSALITPAGNCAAVLACVLRGELSPCYDGRILAEYQEVLCRSRLSLPGARVKAVLDLIRAQGEAAAPPRLPPLAPDPDDTKFWEVAVHLEALLVTGNAKHYPRSPLVATPARALALAPGAAGQRR